MRARYLFLFGLASLTACTAAHPSATQLAEADIGPMPDQADSERVAREYLNAVLKDPMSAIVAFSELRRGWYSKGFRWDPAKLAWRLPAAVNAKNSYGGYTGAKAYNFFFLEGQLVAVQSQDGQGWSVVERGAGGRTLEEVSGAAKE